MQQTDVMELVKELVDAYRSMGAPGVALGVEMDPTVPEKALLDPLRVKQILSNGLTNALKNTLSGTVMFKVPCRAATLSRA